LGPPHRLICERLPSATTIDVDLATVVPTLGEEYLHRQTPTDPEFLDFELRWDANGKVEIVRARMGLGRSEQ
jgi:hypothetical protein